MSIDLNALAQSVLLQESRGDPNAVNPKTGASGLMQVMPDTARAPGYGVRPLDWNKRFDPNENARFGFEYLGAMYKNYGNEVDTLVAYNWGPGNADRWIKGGRRFDRLPKETQDYVTKVANNYRQIAGTRVAQNTSVANDAPPPDFMEQVLGASSAPAAAPTTPAPAGPEGPVTPDLSANVTNAGPPPDFMAQVLGDSVAPAAPAGPTYQDLNDNANNITPGASEALRMGVNELNSVVQGVNPVVGDRTMPIATVHRGVPEGMVDIGDGEFRPIEDFPGDKYYVQDVGGGMIGVFPRTEDSRPSGAFGTGWMGKVGDAAASIGRFATLGFHGSTASLAEPAPLGEAGQVASNFAEAGVRMLPSNVSEGGAFVENTIEGFIPTQRFAKRGQNAQEADVLAAAGRTVEGVGGGTTDALATGARLRAGGEEFKKGFKARTSALYDKAVGLIPGDTAVTLSNTGQWLQEQSVLFRDMPKTAAMSAKKPMIDLYNEIQTVYANFNGNVAGARGPVALNELVALREGVGDRLSRVADSSDVSANDLRTLYRVLSDDIRATLDSVDPGAARLWDRANAYSTAGQNRIDNGLKILFGNASDENVAAGVRGMMNEAGSKTDVRALTQIKRSVGDEDWDLFRLYATERLGVPKNAEVGTGFQIDQFVKTWETLSPSAREVVWGSPNGGIHRELDNLYKVTKRIVDSRVADEGVGLSKQMQTAMAIGAIASVGAASSSYTAPLVALAGSQLSAKYFMSPRFVSALTAYLDKGITDPMLRIAQSSSPYAVGASRFLSLLETPEKGPQ